MSGYWVVRGSEVVDQDALVEYGKLWGPIAKKYGAEIIAGKGGIETKEGIDYPRQLVIRFPTYENAIQCYEDPAYVEAMVYANKAYKRKLSILEGQ